MDALAQAESCGEVMSSWWRGSAAKKVLLMAGIAAVVVYNAGDVLSGLLYDGYSFRNQAISELSAFGSPVRPLMATVIVIHGAVLLAFGIGILRVAEQRSLRWVGWLLVAGFFVVGLWNHTFWAMSARDLETGFNDTMHIALTGVFSLLVVAMMVLSAVAYRGRFRLYSLLTVLVMSVFGIASVFAMRGLEQNDTPWAGGFERINAYAYFAWLVVLAVAVMRRELPATRSRSEPDDTGANYPIAA